MLAHGGNLADAVQRFGRARELWVDLSTGINPRLYPIPSLAADAWHRLPEARADLLLAAQDFYQAPHLLPVAGSQAAIQALPGLRARSRVVIAAPSYAEHAHAWRRAGHLVREVPFDDLQAALPTCDVLVLCNPNNPTGARIAPSVLLDWAATLASRQGWLLVDEAFADVTPALSICQQADREGLIVLRSLGKFFGLAGMRTGFVAAPPALLTQLADVLGPWTVSGPAQEIAQAALRDLAWQAGTREFLSAGGLRLSSLLKAHGIAACGTSLFQWWPEARPEAFHEHMARRGIWVRLFPDQARGIRLGLPGSEAHWSRLESALVAWSLSESKT